jgi:triacylglycerol lipase
MAHDPPVLTPKDAKAIPTWRAAYSDRTSAMMAAFSELAYAPFVDDQPPPASGEGKREKEGGRADLARRLSGGDFELAAVFNKDDVQAYLAVNQAEFAVLAFRGTANLADWKIDLNAGRIPMPGFKHVGVHRGFWGAFAAMEDAIRAATDQHVPADLGLYITGHSLGGALAQIASAALERDNLAACYTFGSPRVATLNFDRCVKCPHYRVVDHWDLVPGVPPPTPWGYLHSGDPRLLVGERPREALRRDRGFLAQALVDLWSFTLWPLTRRLGVVDDHMIWNYRKRLESIAAARAPAEP